MSKRFNRTILRKIGRKLRQERINLDRSMGKVMHQTGLPLEALDKIESGNNKNWEEIMQLADYYGKRIRFILADGLPPEYQEEEEA